MIFEAKKGRDGFIADVLYTDHQSKSEVIPPPINLSLKTTSKTTLLTLAYLYEIYNRDGTVLDLLAGARYWDVDTELRFGGGLGILAGRKIKNDESWVDPIVGIKR